MRASVFGQILLAFFLLGCVVSDETRDSDGSGKLESHEEKIVGGNEVGTCGFPTVAEIGGCSATLIHPRVLLTAAHCGQPNVATFGEQEGAPIRRNINCAPVPGNRQDGADTMFCLMDREIDLPITPIAMGCELDNITPGNEVIITGFGLTGFNNFGSGGTKRWSLAPIRSVNPTNNFSLIGTPAHSACPGDSGGPVFMRLDDGSLRVFGNVSRGTTGLPCNGDGLYPLVHSYVPWFESVSGIDITPCHDADGTWNPGPDCGGFYAGDHRATGQWDNLCSSVARSGPGASCGAVAGPGNDPEPSVECTLVPQNFIAKNDGCDCPENGETSCDPDCAISNGASAACGCDYCYGAAPTPPPAGSCDVVPTQFLAAGDGCDCPLDGSQGCDSDCSTDGNGGAAPCGCDYCY